MPSIAAVGDSITVGVGAGNKSYIDILGGQKFAIGGKASYSLLGMAEQAAAAKPEYIVVFAGINNPMSARGCKGGWDQGLISDLGTMYSTARSAGAKVVGVTLIPALKIWRGHYNKCAKAKKEGKKRPYGCCGNSEVRNPSAIHEKILGVNSWIRSNADIVVDAAATLADDNGLINTYGRDGIHPNAQGHAWIANEIKKRIGGGGTISAPKKQEPTSTPPVTPTSGAPKPVSAPGEVGRYRGWRSFKKEHPDFDFKTFYKDLEKYFENEGGAESLLPRHGRDHKFGAEHHRAWVELQKKKSEEGNLLESIYKRWNMIIS